MTLFNFIEETFICLYDIRYKTISKRMFVVMLRTREIKGIYRKIHN